jgi:molecular chaperone IbpA
MTQLALRSLFNILQNHPTELTQYTVGFDRLFDDIRSQLQQVSSSTPTYPPHNIRKVKDHVYALDIAVAGFKHADIEVSVEKQVLTIKGTKSESSAKDDYLYRGLALRSFEKQIPLVDTAEVRDAWIEDGILTVLVENVIPEKARKKLIKVASTARLPE